MAEEQSSKQQAVLNPNWFRTINRETKTMVMMGSMELLLLLFFAGGPFSDLLGLPPGERDAQLVHAAAENSMLYLEWAERGEGKPGAKGVDGMVADPEVKHFVERVMTQIKRGVTQNMPPDAPQRPMLAALPEFVVAFSGRPGCMFVSLDEEAAGQANDPWTAVLGRINAGLVINAGDKADEFTDILGQWISQIPGMQKPEKFDRLQLPLPVPAFLHHEGDRIILAVGRKTLDQILARLKSGDGGLATNKVFTAAWDELKLERVGSISWLDVKAATTEIPTLIDGSTADMVSAMLDVTGFSGLENVMSVTGVVDGEITGRIKATTKGEFKGLMTFMSGRAITADDFKLVPSDSDVVIAASFDARKVLNSIREVVDGIEPGTASEFDEGIAEFEEEFGLDVEKDILDAFGDVVTISNSPGDGGFVANMPVLTLQVKKPAGAVKTVRKFAAYFDKNGTPREEDGKKRRGRGEYLERKEFMGQRLYMLNFVGSGDMIVSPTFAVTRTHFMFALHPQALKSRLRRQANEANWKPYAFAPKMDGDVVAFSAVKTAEIIPDIYGFLPWFASSVFSDLQRGGIEMDTFDFPSAQGILPYVSDSESVLVRTKGGLRVESTRPPFFGVFGSVPAVAPMFMFGFAAPMRVAEPVMMEAIPADAIDIPERLPQ